MRFSFHPIFYRRLAIAICISCFSIAEVYSHGSLTFGSESRTIGVNGGKVHLDLTFVGSVGLAGLQFKIISASPAVRLLGIKRGERVADASAWSLDYSVSRGGDTIIAVLWSCNRSSLAAGNYDELLSIDIGSASSSSTEPGTLILKEVYSALADGLGNSAGVAIGSPASVDISIEKKMSSHLSQNFPNPCNPSTLIRYVVPEQGHVTLKVYNVAGQEVKTVIDKVVAAGEFEVVLSMDDLPSGVYFYRFSGTGFNDVRKMMLLK